MKRRQLIGYGLTGAASTAALTACAQSTTPTAAGDGEALPTVRWKMATSWPKSLDTLFGAAEIVCDRIAAMTDGRFTIEPYAGGEIVPGLQVLDAVQDGTVECGHSAAYYYVGKSPALAFGTAVPFGLNAQQQNAWLYHGGGLEAMQKLYAKFNIINFPAGNTGVQMGGWFNKEINTAGDLQGLKMRIPGLGGKVMAKLGVNVQNLPGSEIFLALERGAIDAAEWVGPYDDEKLGLQKAAQFYYYPGWWEPGPAFDMMINMDAWTSLPPIYQEVVKTACVESNISTLGKYDAVNGAALQSLLGAGVQLKPFSDEILAAAEKAAFEIYEESANEDADFKEIYDGWKSFRDSVYGWNRLNELGFASFANKEA
ncbi:TRAP transporter substrate-binding protein [Leptothoe spongobia]|uniref:TRAP transporter substrate-binding protein n=1 Tax=Leptothoe spongobia TAU-MAC 1115 TaxID=1967444 RepID=A0A947DC10_9CYAN|nr:TRAP transporter substrate-binding protein [Leptothoe spongobia]MBT9314297.1 TRAP transporter substrate-binding protein [Leptothoe spongobia TAU-MAC 1115]